MKSDNQTNFANSANEPAKNEQTFSISELAKEFSAPLVNAPEANNGNSQHASANVTEHPTLKNVKEGVPLKTSAHAAANQHAVDRLNENVRNNPELQKQLGNELQQRLAMQATHSTAPTPRAT